MIVDVHHHLICEPGYPEALLRAMDQAGIERAGIMAMGKMFERLFVTSEKTVGPLAEEDVAALLRSHPDRFFGYVYVRLGCDGPDKIRRWAGEGFAGVKFHVPRGPYSHESFFPVYEAAQELDLVCLFHTGLISVPFPRTAGERIASEHTRPVHVEAVCHEFPRLRVILAHMGGVWAEEACGMMRLLPNVYADMSGRTDGWRKGKSAAWFSEMLFWPGAADKLLFGSDVHCSEIGQALEDQGAIVRALGWYGAAERRFLGGNARELFRLR